jgi:hypothetical protein
MKQEIFAPPDWVKKHVAPGGNEITNISSSHHLAVINLWFNRPGNQLF